MSLTQESLLQFMSDSLGVDASQVKVSSPLFSSGVVDSFALVALMTFIESGTGIRIGPEDVSLDNFDSIEKMLAFVASKQA